MLCGRNSLRILVLFRLVLGAITLELFPDNVAGAPQLYSINSPSNNTQYLGFSIYDAEVNQSNSFQPINIFLIPRGCLLFPLSRFLPCAISFIRNKFQSNAVLSDGCKLHRIADGECSPENLYSCSAGLGTYRPLPHVDFSARIEANEMPNDQRFRISQSEPFSNRKVCGDYLSHRVGPIGGKSPEKICARTIANSALRFEKGCPGFVVCVPQSPIPYSTDPNEEYFVVQCHDLTAIIVMHALPFVHAAVSGNDDLILRQTHDDHSTGFDLGICTRAKQETNTKYEHFHVYVKSSEVSTAWLGKCSWVLYDHRVYISWDESRCFEIIGMISQEIDNMPNNSSVHNSGNLTVPDGFRDDYLIAKTPPTAGQQHTSRASPGV